MLFVDNMFLRGKGVRAFFALFLFIYMMKICLVGVLFAYPVTTLKEQSFKGKTITLNFQNINKRAVLQVIADFTGINMVVSEKVQGNITLRLTNLPWDEALDIILKTQGLEKHYAGQVMVIDTKDNRNNMQARLLKGKQMIQKLESLHSELLQINYAKAVDLALLVKDKENSLLSERGKISVDARTNTLWIQDRKSNIKEVRQLVKRLDAPVQQVLIEARIVEVNKDFSQDLGIKWGVSKPSVPDVDQGSKHLPSDLVTQAVPLTDRLNLDLAVSPIGLASTANLGIALAKLSTGILLDLELSALESEGRADLISCPRVITTNQQTALIESGEEIPYQEASSSGATSVSFKKAVLSLNVTPQIMANGKILMSLQINQDTASLEKYNGVPAIYTKQIKTNVLVNDGQTIVLGGIYKKDKNKSINRVPFFGALPVIGALFKNKQMSLKNEELLIFITPKIIGEASNFAKSKDSEQSNKALE
ncbi:MAG: type IV pilus secretin PilQ [Legionella sp.]|nr:type IV pilus secretin PilQ [Legionella sp.]